MKADAMEASSSEDFPKTSPKNVRDRPKGRLPKGGNVMRRSCVVLVLALAVVGLVGVGSSAQATVSGPNGQIAFARQIPTGGANVYVSNPDGSDATQVPLVYPAEDFGIPRWSPDGSKLLISHVLRFDSSGNLLPFRPATVNLDGSNFNLLEPPNAPFDMGCFTWYTNGARLLCNFGVDQPGIFSIRASDGGDPVRLSTNPFGAVDAPTDVSPDGSRFVFLRYRPKGGREPRIDQVALFVENIDGTGLRQITPYGLAHAHEIASARWSPDGQEIISETTRGLLFMVHSDGSGLTMLPLQPGTTQSFAFEPDWSPDGTRIVFCMWLNGREDVYTAKTDGTDVVQVTNTPDIENGPDWGVATG
jgi:Tol biopolymer transport system component